MGAFREDGCTAAGGKINQGLFALRPLPWKKAEEGEPIEGQPRQYRRRKHRRRAGEDGIREISFDTCLDQHRPGVGDARHARVGYVNDIKPRLELLQKLGSLLLLGVFVAAYEGLFDAQMIEELGRLPGVLTPDLVTGL